MCEFQATEKPCLKEQGGQCMRMTVIELWSPSVGSHSHQHTHTHSCAEQQSRTVFRSLPWVPALTSFTDGLWAGSVRQSKTSPPWSCFWSVFQWSNRKETRIVSFNWTWNKFKLGWLSVESVVQVYESLSFPYLRPSSLGHCFPFLCSLQPVWWIHFIKGHKSFMELKYGINK